MGALVNALAGTPLDTGIDAHDLSTLSTFWCAQLLHVQVSLLLLQPALRRPTHLETQALLHVPPPLLFFLFGDEARSFACWA